MNEAQVPITPSLGADFRTQVLTLVSSLCLQQRKMNPAHSLMVAQRPHRGFSTVCSLGDLEDEASGPPKSPGTARECQKSTLKNSCSAFICFYRLKI